MPFEVRGTRAHYTVALCLGKAWVVRLECAACDREPAMWAKDELERLPPGAQLGRLAARAKCAGCGSVDGQLSTRQGKWNCAPSYNVRPAK